jgi:hypothetical protein
MTTMLEIIREMMDSGKAFMPLAEHLGFRVKAVELVQAAIEFEAEQKAQV